MIKNFIITIMGFWIDKVSGIALTFDRKILKVMKLAYWKFGAKKRLLTSTPIMGILDWFSLKSFLDVLGSSLAVASIRRKRVIFEIF